MIAILAVYSLCVASHGLRRAVLTTPAPAPGSPTGSSPSRSSSSSVDSQPSTALVRRACPPTLPPGLTRRAPAHTAPEPLQVGDHIVTQKSLYTGLMIIGIPLLWFAAPLSALFWLVGSSAVCILGHASVMEPGVERYVLGGQCEGSQADLAAVLLQRVRRCRGSLMRSTVGQMLMAMPIWA